MTAACFGLYVGVVYIQKGAELLVFEFNDSTTAAGWLAAFIAVAFTVTTYLMEKAAHRSYGPLWLRQLMVDFTFIIGVIFWSGFAHIPGNMNSVPLEMVPITRSWFPTLQCVHVRSQRSTNGATKEELVHRILAITGQMDLRRHPIRLCAPKPCCLRPI
jgi:hypothetical protein